MNLLGAAENVVTANESPPPGNHVGVLVRSEADRDRVFQKVEHLIFPLDLRFEAERLISLRARFTLE